MLAALQQARLLFPFPIQGIDTDNGGEFINEAVITYCEQAHITFTCGRPYLKNDQCFVEQKNGAIVRQVIGHDCLVGEHAYKQQELTEVARALDPIRLLHQLEQLQQAVFRCAVGCSPFISSPLSDLLHVCSVEQCTAGKLPDEGSFPNPAAGLESLYREQERRKRVLGWRRTHKDPFEGEWEQIFSWLQANPERSSGDIFRELQRRSPGRYQSLQIRTLQRGMRKIRAYLLETVKDGWQEEVIRGPSPSRVSAGCSTEIS